MATSAPDARSGKAASPSPAAFEPYVPASESPAELENIVQTIGSAGESVAGGVVFTVPALIGKERGTAQGRSLCGILYAVLVGTKTIGPLQTNGHLRPWLRDEYAFAQVESRLLFLGLAVVTVRMAQCKVM